MGLLPEKICGNDVDDLLKYKTPVLVAIRDRRLGALNLFFLLAAISYVFVYQILYKAGYLLVVTPTGSYRFSLREPTNVFGCDPVTDFGCSSEFPKLTDLPYCVEGNASNAECPTTNLYQAVDGQTCVKRRDCRLLDDIDVAIAEGNEFFLTTRRIQVAQLGSCNDTEADLGVCTNLWEEVPNSSMDSYVAAVEDYTLLLDHAVRDSSGTLNVGGTSNKMKGLLYVPSNNDFCQAMSEKGKKVTSSKGGSPTTSAPCYVDPSNVNADGYDVLTISEWLAAAGLDLDAPVQTGNHLDEPIRGRGHIVVISIDYTNIEPWSGASDEISYEYTISFIKDSSFKITKGENVFRENSTSVSDRIVMKNYGIKFVVLQNGRLGRFDFNVLLLQLAAGSALLGIASLFTDLLALHVLPQKKLYSEAKIKQTEDFSDIRQHKQHHDVAQEVENENNGTSMMTSA